MDILRQLRNEHPDLSLEQLEKIATAKIVADAPKSRAFYRIQVKKVYRPIGVPPYVKIEQFYWIRVPHFPKTPEYKN